MAEEQAPEAAGKPGRRKRRFLAALLLGVPLLGLLAVGGWALHILGQRRRLERRLAELRAELDADRSRVGEAENAAPLYRRAFKLHVAPELLDELLDRAQKEDTRFDFRSPKVCGYLRENRKFLAALKEAASRPKCTFIPASGFEPGGRPGRGHFEGFSWAIGCLRLATGNAVAAGRVDEALGHIEMLLRMGDHLGRDGGLLDSMSEKTAEGRAALELESMLNGCSPDEKQLVRALKAIDSSSLSRRDFSRAIRHSRVSEMTSFAEALHGGAVESPRNEEARPDTGESRDFERGMLLMRWSGRGYADLRNMDRFYARAASAACEPYPTCLQKLQALGDEAHDRFKRNPTSGAMVFTTLSLTALVPCIRVAVDRSARLDAARLGVGCRLFRLKTGSYPQTLAQLSQELPQLFARLPLDPFTGKSFGYKRTQRGCLIWSVGRDGTDDGGDATSDAVFELKE